MQSRMRVIIVSVPFGIAENCVDISLAFSGPLHGEQDRENILFLSFLELPGAQAVPTRR